MMIFNTTALPQCENDRFCYRGKAISMIKSVTISVLVWNSGMDWKTCASHIFEVPFLKFSVQNLAKMFSSVRR